MKDGRWRLGVAEWYMGKWRNTEPPVEGVHEPSGPVSPQDPENEVAENPSSLTHRRSVMH